MDPTNQQEHITLHLVMLAFLVFSSACTSPAHPTSTIFPSQAFVPVTESPSATPRITSTVTLPPPTITPSPTPFLPTNTPTILKPTTRIPTSTIAPTSALINRNIKLSRSTGAYLLSFADSGLTVVYNNLIERVDPTSGKILQSTKIGCEVCFGACDQFSATRDGQYFWVLQYGGIGENKCTSEQPWANVGFSLRKIKPGSSSVEVFDVTSILEKFEHPSASVIAVKDNLVFLAYGEVVYVIDAARSTNAQPSVIKTFFPGIYVEGMLFANDTLWIAGDALLAVNPKTFTVGIVYPLAAQLLATDGKTMWGISRDHVTLQSINLTSRVLGDLIDLPDEFYLPTAVGFDGKDLWISFTDDTRLVVYPVQ